jgi:hypothetical protein
MPERRDAHQSQARYVAIALVAVVCLLMIGVLKLVG